MGLNFSLKLSLLLAAGFIEIAILGFWLILFRCEPFSMAHKWANTINERSAMNYQPTDLLGTVIYVDYLSKALNEQGEEE